MTTDAAIAASVAEHGWHAISVSDVPNPFVYTCGLITTFDHPEFVIFDPDPRAGYDILAVMVQDIRSGRSFAEPGKFDRVLVEGDVAVRRVHPTQHEFYLGYAMGHWRHTGRLGGLEVVQVFWPDRDGHFPFDQACDASVYRAQPRLDLEIPVSEIEDRRAELGS